MQKLTEYDICMVIPASLASGDPGEPLSNTVKSLIHQMAKANYWPVDFGEASDDAIELWFSCANVSGVTPVKLADHFIQANGDV